MRSRRIAAWDDSSGTSVFPIQKFKESYPEPPKSDWVNAFVNADHLHFVRIAKEGLYGHYRCQPVRTLIRARFDAIQNLTYAKQGLQTTYF